MKSLKGQLIAAIAMTLVAIVTISSSTYAWFSMNTAVTATGMSVKAASTGGLAIGAYTSATVAPVASAFKSEAAAIVASEALSLTPASSSTLISWYTATAETVDSYAKKDTDSYTAISSGLDSYRLESKFQIKSLDESSSTKALYITGVTVGVKDKTSAVVSSKVLNKALRVAVLYQSKAYYYAPVYASTDSIANQCVSSTTELVDYPNSITSGTGPRSSSIGDVSNTAKDITVYVYYEGEDANCKSVNAIDIDTLQVTISFSTQQPTTT